MTGSTAVGWPVLDDDQVQAYRLQLRGGVETFRFRPGDVATILCDVVCRFDQSVASIVGPVLDDWSHNKRPVRGTTGVWSEHAAGSALDVDALLHPRGVRGTFTPAQVAAIEELLDFYEGVVEWGGHFGLPGHTGHVPDEMHFQINVPPGDPDIHRIALKVLAAQQEDQVLDKDIDAIADKVIAKLGPQVAGQVAKAIAAGAFAAVQRYFEQPFAHIGDETDPQEKSPLDRHFIVAVRGIRDLVGKVDQLLTGQPTPKP